MTLRLYTLREIRELVKLVSAVGFKKQRQFGSAKRLIKMADDFDEPLEEFRGYM